jgi:hypothetical protein
VGISVRVWDVHTGIPPISVVTLALKCKLY